METQILSYSTSEQVLLNQLQDRARQNLTYEDDPELNLNPDVLIRFLRAREMDIDAAFEMWIKWKEWRHQFQVDSITEESVMPLIQTGKAFWHGHDKHGRPVLIIRIRYHIAGAHELQDIIRHSVYLIEQGIKLADSTGSGQVSVIYDRGQLSDRNKDPELIETSKKLMGLMQDYYAERLGNLFVLHVNWFYWFMWQCVKPLINKKTRSKIHVLKNGKGLLEYIDSDQLLREYGGTNDYVHPYPQ